MAYDRGLLRIEELQAFKDFCFAEGVVFTDGKGEYQALAVFYGAQTCVVTRNTRDVLATPTELRPLIDRFRAQKVGITDTQRLDFMLCKWRKVVTEVTPRNHEVYVEEGFMADKTYPAVVVSNDDWAELDKAGEDAIKRQAIDLAINQQE